MDFLSLAFLLLIAGVIAVPIALKLGLGSVLGYLIAGIAISPLLTTFCSPLTSSSALSVKSAIARTEVSARTGLVAPSNRIAPNRDANGFTRHVVHG